MEDMASPSAPADVQDLSLLSTKLRVPPVRAELISRPRLIERLNAGRAGKLTLVSAAAGFGKTTLLSAWVTETGQPVGWMALDPGDSDPTRFWTYLLAALERLLPGVGDGARSMLLAPQPPLIERVLTALINEVAAAVEREWRKSGPRDRPYTLVLDDYHVVEAPPIHAGMRFLLDHLPTGLHLVIATRADPPLRLSRLRARGQLVEIRQADLRFTRKEAAAFLSRATGLDLARQDVAALEMRTEGWITGLQLAALSLQGHDDVQGFVQSFAGSHRYILDYLMDEVLSGLAADLQAFLFQTAILDRLCGPLCDAVRERSPDQPGSQAMLERLAQANLFLLPLDDERRWYRYHRLFADLLRARGKDDADPAERHRRAARWYQGQRLSEEAFEHWLQAGALVEAATLVEAHGLARLNQGQTALVRSWVERLPSDLVAGRPWLLVLRAWSLLLTGDVREVTAGLEKAVSAAVSTGAGPELLGHVAAIRAYMAALQGDVTVTIDQAQQALAQLAEDDQATRSVVAFVLGGMRILIGQVTAAQVAFAEAAEMAQAAGNRHVAVPAWCAVAFLEEEQGSLRQAQATYQRALALATVPGGKPLPLAAQPYNGLARLAYERDDLAAAEGWLDTSLALSRQWHSPETILEGLLARATLHRARGQLAQANAAWQEAADGVDAAALTPLAASRLAAARQALWLATGEVAVAARDAVARGMAPDDPANYLREAEQVTLARILLAQGRAGEAEALLARVAAAAQKDGRTGRLIGLLNLQALACAAQRKMEQAHIALGWALALAEPEGYVRAFVDEGEPLARLLVELRDEGGRRADYAGKLLAAFPDMEPQRSASPALRVALIEPLSDRELEVLRLIAAGSSNRAIADELVIALGTVKAHTAAIYRKLDVRSRTQAVARARALGLLA